MCLLYCLRIVYARCRFQKHRFFHFSKVETKSSAILPFVRLSAPFRAVRRRQRKKTSVNISAFLFPFSGRAGDMSAYSSNTALIENYISPIVGNMKLSDVTARVLEKYYMQLLKTPSVHRITQKEGSKDVVFVAPPTVRKVHNVLRSAFHQAVKWELMEKNPAMYATVPKVETKKREIWDAPTLFHAIEVCEDERLKLSINLAFACSLRIGELLGLTWDCVDISPESIAAGKACSYVNKELQRVSKSVMKTLERKDVLRVFPELRESNKTVLVLKKPKTATSTRKIFLPKTVGVH